MSQSTDSLDMQRTIQKRLLNRGRTVKLLAKLFVRGYVAANHLPQLIFLSKLPAQDLQVANQTLAAVDQSFLRGDLAVRLDAKLEGGEERVGN